MCSFLLGRVKLYPAIKLMMKVIDNTSFFVCSFCSRLFYFVWRTCKMWCHWSKSRFRARMAVADPIIDMPEENASYWLGWAASHLWWISVVFPQLFRLVLFAIACVLILSLIPVYQEPRNADIISRLESTSQSLIISRLAYPLDSIRKSTEFVERHLFTANE